MLSLSAQSRAGRFAASLTLEQNPARRIQPVEASIIAMLKRKLRAIGVG